MKKLYTLFLLLFNIIAGAQNPAIIKNVGNNETEPKNKDQNEWTFNEWKGKRFYQGTGGAVRLCVTDGTSAGTIFLKSLGNASSIRNMIAAEDFMYIITTGTSGTFPSLFIVNEIWRSDGTADGTTLVKTMDPHGFTVAGNNFTSDALNYYNYSVEGNLMYFTGYDAVNGAELWRSDGTAIGTHIVKNIRAGSASSLPGGFCKVGNNTVFRAGAAGLAATLWQTDGTEAGTVEIVVPGMTYFDPPAGRINNKVIFFGNDAVNGVEPWVTDGTPEGTFLLADINPGTGRSLPSSVQNLHLKFNDKYVFFLATNASGTNLWRTDGTVAGTIKLSPDGLITGTNYTGGGYSAINNYGVYWIGNNEMLYFSNGTPEGTRKISGTLSNIQYLAIYKNAAWFHGRQSAFINAEPWRSDGTAANTNIAFEIQPGTLQSEPYGFFELNNKLYFLTAAISKNLYEYNGDMTFNGSLAGNQWKDSANWNSMMPPGVTDTVYVNAGETPIISGRKAFAGRLLLANGASVGITNASDSLFVGQSLASTGGNTFNGAGALVLAEGNGGVVSIDNGFTADNLTIQSNATLLNGTLNIGNQLAFTTGKLQLNDNNVVLTGTTSTAIGNALAYAITNGNGKLMVENIGAGARTGAVTFPVGTQNNYNPAVLANTGVADNFGIRVQPGINGSYTGEIPSGNAYTTNSVDATWLISEQTAGGSNATITLQWNEGQELPGFNRNISSFAHYTTGWETGTPDMAAGNNPYTFSGSGITGFSPFGILNPGGVLPIASALVAVTKQAGIPVVNWNIIANNAATLTIQRSFNGVQFTDIHGQPFVAKSTYNDVTVGLRNKVYYRLKITDRNGQTSYTNNAMIDLQSNKVIAIYPTLFAGSLTIQNYLSGVMVLQLFNVEGKIQHQQKLVQGVNTINTTNIPKGTYMYKIIGGTAQNTGIVIKQ